MISSLSDHSKDYIENIYFALVREFVWNCGIFVTMQQLSGSNLSESSKRKQVFLEWWKENGKRSHIFILLLLENFNVLTGMLLTLT